MMKTFKKALAIMMTVIFVISLVPAGVMAEESQETISLKINTMDYGYVRKDKESYYDDVYYKSVSYLRCRAAYPGHIKLDLTGYEEILKNEGTAISISFNPRSGYSLNCFEIVLANDACDTCDYSALNYSTATSLDFYNEDRPVLYVRSDAAISTAFTTDNLNLSGLVDVMDENPENSNVALWLKHVSGDTYFAGSSTFNITYDTTKVDNEAYVKEIANELTWDVISSDAADLVSHQLNLPKKLYGADITWTSSDNDIINPSSGEILIKSATPVPVTLTADITYTNALGESASLKEPLTFELKARLPVVTAEGYIPLTNGAQTRSNSANKNSTYGFGTSNYTKGDAVYKHLRFGGQYYSNAQFDFTGYEEILKNPGTKANVSFNTRYMGTGGHVAYDYKVYMIADSNDKYVGSDVSYVIATETYDMYNTAGRPIFYTKSPANAVYSSGERGTFGGEVNVDSIVSVLGEGTDNSLITLCFESEYDESFITVSGYEISTGAEIEVDTGLTITYDVNEIDNEAYLADVKNALTESVLSKGDINKVSADLYLPAKFMGADIVWETDGVVIKSSGEVDFANNKGETVTLTAKMSYTNILGDTVTDEKKFTVTISDGTYYEIGEPTLEIADDKFKASWSIENYTGEDVTYYVYLAAYLDNELVGLTPVEYIAKNGEPTNIAPSVAYEEGYTAKLIILESDHITPLFAATEK